MASNLRYIIEALRQKPIEPGITRDQGHPVRRMAGPLLGSPIADANKDVNYRRYVKMQSDMGESPVSYEEWVKNAS